MMTKNRFLSHEMHQLDLKTSGSRTAMKKLAGSGEGATTVRPWAHRSPP